MIFLNALRAHRWKSVCIRLQGSFSFAIRCTSAPARVTLSAAPVGTKVVTLNCCAPGRIAMHLRASTKRYVLWGTSLRHSKLYSSSASVFTHFVCELQLYNMDTGEEICYNEPLYGEGQFPSSGQHFNEAGYAVGIPPCLWGSEEEGLLPPPRLSLNTRLRSVKHVNSTYYHYGVMAQWQMRGKWTDPA